MPGHHPTTSSLAAASRRTDIANLRTALFYTLPGRAMVVGVAIKLFVFVLRWSFGPLALFFSVVDTVAGLAVAAGAVYFLFRLAVLAKRRLLWRVRRKLILSYIFIGFVPALLIVAFFLLCGFLLFYSFSSYLVQSRLRALTEQTRFIAGSTAVEIQRGGGRGIAELIARKTANFDPQFPGLSIAVVPVNRACADTSTKEQPTTPPTLAGPWTHVDPPTTIPGWIDCSGFAGVLAYSHRPTSGVADEDTHVLVRAAAFPDTPRPGYGVVIDVPISDRIKQALRRETGVEVNNASAVNSGVKPLAGRPGGHAARPQGAAAPAASPFNSFSFLEYVDWNTGERGTLVVSMQLNMAETYDRISAAQGFVGTRSYGQLLLIFLFVIGGLFLLIEFFALIAGFALAKSITGSVHALFAGTERVRQGDFTQKIAVRTEDQLGELAGSFNQMTASIEDLLRQSAEKKRLEEELRIAHEIQMSLLPQGPLTMPGLSVTALCVPAREVGGDYYDFLPLDDHRLGLLIADVSGKGTSAALYMAELKGLILSLSRIHTSPRELLIDANRIIAEHLDARSFITMTYAILDLRQRTMTYARAGHTPLIYVPGPGSESRRVRILAPDGLVLGLKIDNGEMFERLLQEETLPLRTGDLYVFFTDGISEAMNEQDDCFGEERLGRLAESQSDLPSDQLRERVLREIETFVGGAPQHDDMTMLLLKVDDVAVTEVETEPAALVETR
jgi:serine phosphatase RsbU (regulator of sigma subunit)